MIKWECNWSVFYTECVVVYLEQLYWGHRTNKQKYSLHCLVGRVNLHFYIAKRQDGCLKGCIMFWMMGKIIHTGVVWPADREQSYCHHPDVYYRPITACTNCVLPLIPPCIIPYFNADKTTELGFILHDKASKGNNHCQCTQTNICVLWVFLQCTTTRASGMLVSPHYSPSCL